MNQLISILGEPNVNFIKKILMKIYESRGREWEGDFMIIPSGKMEMDEELPEPVLGWFNKIIFEKDRLIVSAVKKHQIDETGYPSEADISEAFKFDGSNNLIKESNGENTLSIGFNFGDRNIMQVFGIAE